MTAMRETVISRQTFLKTDTDFSGTGKNCLPYKRLVDTGRYDVASLSVRFGKSEAYIRNHLRLNDLTEDILALVNEDAIPVSIALELCKYSADIQADVYEKHLKEDTGYYTGWRNLKTGDFVKRLESAYCNDLSRYHFDKTACVKCPFNTNCYSLFADESREGKCAGLHCLTGKNRQYPVDSCKNIIRENPAMEICRRAYRMNTNDDVYLELSVQGYGINEDRVQSFPEKPEEPKREDFEADEDFETARDTYSSQLADYMEAGREIERLLSEGKARQTVTVSNNEVITGYVMLPESENFALFLEAPQNRWHLTDEDRITIINNLTEE
ncbi:MAG: hypothetical protein LBQ73_05365, partial [Tannerellaceae bacterium]|nr:hypothetical protein [Tannerellaceae bacterium]